MASPRMRAASMAMARFSLSLLCPVKSARRRGRSPASNCRSSAWRSPETSFRSGMCYQLTVPVPARAGKAVRRTARAKPGRWQAGFRCPVRASRRLSWSKQRRPNLRSICSGRLRAWAGFRSSGRRCLRVGQQRRRQEGGGHRQRLVMVLHGFCSRRRDGAPGFAVSHGSALWAHTPFFSGFSYWLRAACPITAPTPARGGKGLRSRRGPPHPWLCARRPRHWGGRSRDSAARKARPDRWRKARRPERKALRR